MKALYFVIYSINDIFDFDFGFGFAHDANDDNDLYFFCFYYDYELWGHDSDDCFDAHYVLNWKNDRMIDPSMVVVLVALEVLVVPVMLVVPVVPVVPVPIVMFVLTVLFVALVLGERFDCFVHHGNYEGPEESEKPQAPLQYQILWFYLQVSLTDDQERSSSTLHTTRFPYAVVNTTIDVCFCLFVQYYKTTLQFSPAVFPTRAIL